MTFEIVHFDQILEEPTAVSPGAWTPRTGEKPVIRGRLVRGDVARLADGRLLGRSAGREFGWVDAATLRWSPTPQIDWEAWFNKTREGFSDGWMRIDIVPPDCDPLHDELDRFSKVYPLLGSLLASGVKPTTAARPLFDAGPIFRPRPGQRTYQCDVIQLLRDFAFFGQWGDYGCHDPATPITDEEAWCHGSDALAVSRSNDIAILVGHGPIRAKYGDVRVTTIRTGSGPKTLLQIPEMR